MLGRVFAGLFFAIFLALGLWLESLSFGWLREMRQMSRIPQTQVHAILPGEVNVVGKASAFGGNVLSAPHSQKSCFYYRYLEEKEKRDSEGKTSWVTVRDETEFINFSLTDETGQVRLQPNPLVDFSLPKVFRTKKGNRRYTEWRIDPDDTITIVGFAQTEGNSMVIDFSAPGDYTPIISSYGALSERGDKAMFSILGSWGGLLIISMSLVCLCRMVGIHRLLLYLILLSILQFGMLAYYGLRLVYEDLNGAGDRIARQKKSLEGIITAKAKQAGGAWEGNWKQLSSFESKPFANLPSAGRHRLTRMRVDLVRSQERTIRQFEAFPEFILAPLMGLKKPDALPLPEADRAMLGALEEEYVETEIFRGRSKMFGWGLIGFGLLAGFGTTWLGVRQIKFKRCIENLPTSKASGVVYGLAEVKGKAVDMEGSEAARGPLSFSPCYYYRYVVKEKVGSDKNAKWVVREDITLNQTFLCEDHTGTIRIDPMGADLMAKHTLSRREGRWSYSETSIRRGDEIYAIGQAAVDPLTETTLYLGKPGESQFPFIVSNFSEFEIMMKKALAGMTSLNFAFSSVVLGILFLAGMFGSFAPTDYLFATLVGPIFLALLTVILHYNDMIFLRQLVDRNWSNIDVSLKKRFDLLPNLQRIVSSYLEHEENVQTEIAKLRSSLSETTVTDPESAASYMKQEHAFATRFLAIRENYPDLKASELVTQMSRVLIELENEIALMREGYNDAVETYNTRIQSVPDTFLARSCGFQEKNFLAFESAILSAPDIKLGQPPPVVAPAKPAPPKQSYQQQMQGKSIRASVSSPATAVASTAVTDAPASPDATAGENAPADLAEGTPIPDLPAELVASITEPAEAEAMLYALVVDETRFTTEDIPKMGAIIDSEDIGKRVMALTPQIDALDKRLKLALLDRALPGMRAANEPGTISDKLRKLIEHDSSISLFEYALLQILEREDARRADNDRPPITQYYSAALLDREVSLIASFVTGLAAHESLAQSGFETFKSTTTQPGLDIERIPFADCSFGEVDEAFGKLSLLDQSRRTLLVKAAAQSVGTREQATANQLDFLRAISERLHVAL
ncbi:MAG: hypothetical protein CMO80_07960 [Verrucomicrobiales bacterium]|nr:hypothetical protein [Verrucomicrobiales bacterium]